MREGQDHEEDDNEGEERNAGSVCDNASQGTNRDYESSGISFKMSKLFRTANVKKSEFLVEFGHKVR